jgi:TonB family protein
MLINRALAMALFISFLWHLFWVSFVSIVFLPSGLSAKKYSSVNFLGSILRSSAFTRLPAERHGGQVDRSEIDIQRQSPFHTRPYLSFPLERKNLDPESFIDVDMLLNRRYAKLSTQTVLKQVLPAGSNSSVQREIIFQPSLPDYPEWDHSEFRGALIMFKIYISAEGLVQDVINVQASGNPGMDAALARYIRRWRFAPAFGSQGQWQTVRISTNLHE